MVKKQRAKDQFSCRLTEDVNEYIKRAAYHKNIHIKDLVLDALEYYRKNVLNNEEFAPVPERKKRLTDN